LARLLGTPIGNDDGIVNAGDPNVSPVNEPTPIKLLSVFDMLPLLFDLAVDDAVSGIGMDTFR
jgi:hypothetical protein